MTAVKLVSDILQEKGSEVFRIDVAASVYEAIEKMVEANVGALLVAEGDQIAGIFTERDYLRRVAVKGRVEKETTVRDVMSFPVICVTRETSIEECMALMSEHRIRHTPVVNGGALVGIISIGDLVEFRTRQQSFQIKYLNEYITAR